MSFLKRLFHPHAAPTDGLTQKQREAIVDLLNYCSLIDHDVSQSEDVEIADLEFELNWDPSIDFDYYVNKSVGEVRGVLESVDSQADFLKAIRSKLDSRKSRKLATDLANKVISADGRVTAEESVLCQAIQNALK